MFRDKDEDELNRNSNARNAQSNEQFFLCAFSFFIAQS